MKVVGWIALIIGFLVCMNFLLIISAISLKIFVCSVITCISLVIFGAGCYILGGQYYEVTYENKKRLL